MTIIIGCNIQLEVGKIYELEDKYTKGLANCKILREATEQEYLNSKHETPIVSKYYYEVSFD